MSAGSDQTSVFEVHRLAGTHEAVSRAAQAILLRLNEHWRKRRTVALVISAVLLAAGGTLAFAAHYFFGLLAVLLALAVGTAGFAAGRQIEVEVETLTLCIELLALLADSVGPQGEVELVIDMRSAVHAARHADARSGASVRDQWFTLAAALSDGCGLQLELSELVRSGALAQASGRRVARDYHVALFASRECEESSLIEAVTSHVAAPSATQLEARVKEGMDAFWAAIQQLRSPRGDAALEARRVEVSTAIRDSGIFNPRGRA